MSQIDALISLAGTQEPASATASEGRGRKDRAMLPPANMSPNLTSMIDVIFLLLIFFVLTANFSSGEGVLTLKLPRGTGSAGASALPPPQSPLIIVLSSHGPVGVSIALQNQPFEGSFGQLATELKSLQFNKQNPDGVYKADNPIIIKPEGDVRWQHVVNAFNAAVTADYTNVSFAQAGG